jgi:TfoX/Sxy family transcriptional regulator of competence genes
MASSAEYLEYALDLLRDVPAVTCKKMMGEYLLYGEGVLFGGIYDDRLLLKDTPASRAAFPEEQTPYEGARPMLLVDSEDPVRVAEVVTTMLAELPKPKRER